MEAPVQWVVVFPLAFRAHRELRHRGLRPVIGNSSCDGEARPAVGAIQKRIAVAPVPGVQQFTQAIRACCRVGWNPCAHSAQHLTGIDSETRIPHKVQLPHRNRINARQRWRLRAQPVKKRLHALLRPLDLYGHSIRIVADKSGQTLLQCQSVDKRTKPHPLHHSAHHHTAPQRFVWPSIELGFVRQVKASCCKPA